MKERKTLFIAIATIAIVFFLFQKGCDFLIDEKRQKEKVRAMETRWKTEKEITKELAIKLEGMNSEQVWCWIQDTLRGNGSGDS